MKNIFLMACLLVGAIGYNVAPASRGRSSSPTNLRSLGFAKLKEMKVGLRGNVIYFEGERSSSRRFFQKNDFLFMAAPDGNLWELVIDSGLNARKGMQCYKEGKGLGEIVSLGDARRQLVAFSAEKEAYYARIVASGLDPMAQAPVFRVSGAIQNYQRLVRYQEDESDETLFFVFGSYSEKVS